MIDLLIIKAGRDYFRVGEKDIHPCPFNKASVFPMSQSDKAREGCRRLQALGIDAVLMKLTIHEEPFRE